MENREKLSSLIETHNRIADASVILDPQTKLAFKNLSAYTSHFLANTPKISSYQFNSLANELLTYWNESITPDTEAFWTELKNKGVNFIRKQPLRFALDKNRFRRVEQGMDARNYWGDLKKLPAILEDFTREEIKHIDRIISEDEKRRLEILKKCLLKKEIPQTYYLKFGECMAYFSNCRLFESYFAQEEVDELYHIWKNFRSK